MHRSSGKVANLTIKATLSNCILHWRGKVTVEGCKLQCYAGGLEHLFTPLVTLATAGLRLQREQLTRPMGTGREAGMGVLSVVETKIRVCHCAFASDRLVKRQLIASVPTKLDSVLGMLRHVMKCAVWTWQDT